MRYIYLLIILCCFSCNNERVLLLPEIENAEVTEVLDVSPAYIFYDETQPDSTLLNRKNLISTTNWLVNVDKRLTLRQAIPHIKFLQDKKRNAKMHKNENAKNYFTCNDSSIKNLGFIEFTDTQYSIKYEIFNNEKIITKSKIDYSINYMSENKILIEGMSANKLFETTTIENFKKELMKLSGENTSTLINCYFNKELSFQDYISFKSKLLDLSSGNITIDTIEYIY